MDKIYLILFYTLWFIVKILPEFALKGFSNLMGILAFYINKKHKKIVLTNLDMCFEKTLTREEKLKITNFGRDVYDYYRTEEANSNNVIEVDFK